MGQKTLGESMTPDLALIPVSKTTKTKQVTEETVGIEENFVFSPPGFLTLLDLTPL